MTTSKENPHSASSASSFGPNQIKFILEMDCTSIQDIQDKAFMCVTIFSGMRTQGVHEVYSKDVILKCASLETRTPRYVELTTMTSKTDRSGVGDAEGRRHRVRK